MTLEKLLIFGTGIAIVTALTVTATNMSNDRAPQYETYRTGVTEMLDKTRP